MSKKNEDSQAAESNDSFAGVFDGYDLGDLTEKDVLDNMRGGSSKAKSLRSGIPFFVKPSDGTTFLHIAARRGDLALARKLVELGSNPLAPKKDDRRLTPLDEAKQQKKSEVLIFLYSKINSMQKNFRTSKNEVLEHFFKLGYLISNTEEFKKLEGYSELSKEPRDIIHAVSSLFTLSFTEQISVSDIHSTIKDLNLNDNDDDLLRNLEVKCPILGGELANFKELANQNASKICKDTVVLFTEELELSDKEKSKLKSVIEKRWDAARALTFEEIAREDLTVPDSHVAFGLWKSLIDGLKSSDLSKVSSERLPKCFEQRRNRMVILTTDKDGDNSAGPALWGASYVLNELAKLDGVVLLPAANPEQLRADVIEKLVTRHNYQLDELQNSSLTDLVEVLTKYLGKSSRGLLIFDGVKIDSLGTEWLRSVMPRDTDGTDIVFCLGDWRSKLSPELDAIVVSWRGTTVAEYAAKNPARFADSWREINKDEVISPPLLVLLGQEEATEPHLALCKKRVGSADKEPGAMVEIKKRVEIIMNNNPLCLENEIVLALYFFGPILPRNFFVELKSFENASAKSEIENSVEDAIESLVTKGLLRKLADDSAFMHLPLAVARAIGNGEIEGKNKMLVDMFSIITKAILSLSFDFQYNQKLKEDAEKLQKKWDSDRKLADLPSETISFVLHSFPDQKDSVKPKPMRENFNWFISAFCSSFLITGIESQSESEFKQNLVLALFVLCEAGYSRQLNYDFQKLLDSLKFEFEESLSTLEKRLDAKEAADTKFFTDFLSIFWMFYLVCRARQLALRDDMRQASSLTHKATQKVLVHAVDRVDRLFRRKLRILPMVATQKGLIFFDSYPRREYAYELRNRNPHLSKAVYQELNWMIEWRINGEGSERGGDYADETTMTAVRSAWQAYKSRWLMELVQEDGGQDDQLMEAAESALVSLRIQTERVLKQYESVGNLTTLSQKMTKKQLKELLDNASDIRHLLKWAKEKGDLGAPAEDGSEFPNSMVFRGGLRGASTEIDKIVQLYTEKLHSLSPPREDEIAGIVFLGLYSAALKRYRVIKESDDVKLTDGKPSDRAHTLLYLHMFLTRAKMLGYENIVSKYLERFPTSTWKKLLDNLVDDRERKYERLKSPEMVGLIDVLVREWLVMDRASNDKIILERTAVALKKIGASWGGLSCAERRHFETFVAKFPSDGGDTLPGLVQAALDKKTARSSKKEWQKEVLRMRDKLKPILNPAEGTPDAAIARCQALREAIKAFNDGPLKLFSNDYGEAIKRGGGMLLDSGVVALKENKKLPSKLEYQLKQFNSLWTDKKHVNDKSSRMDICRGWCWKLADEAFRLLNLDDDVRPACHLVQRIQKKFAIFFSHRGPSNKRSVTSISHALAAQTRSPLNYFFVDHVSIDCGDSNVESVVGAVMASRATVVLLEPSFFTSGWCVAEVFFASTLREVSKAGTELGGKALEYPRDMVPIWVQEEGTAAKFADIRRSVPLPFESDVAYKEEDKTSIMTLPHHPLNDQLVRYIGEFNVY